MHKRAPITQFISCVLIALVVLASHAFAADEVDVVNDQFRLYEINGDAQPEIRFVHDLKLRSDPAGGDKGVVLVVVEPRLLRNARRFEGAEAALLNALRTYVDDLDAAGWRARAVAMQVYDGPVHQDGRTLMAMRRYLQRLDELTDNLSGVVLVGDFPEALLVRQYNWRQHNKTVLHEGTDDEQRFEDEKVYRIRSKPEIVANRCDLILADLDGKWDDLYRIGPDSVPWAIAVYPDASPPDDDQRLSEWLDGGPTEHYESGALTLEDFFFVNDGQYRLEDLPDGRIDFQPLDDRQDAECTTDDLRRGNPIARPEIFISRVNTRHIALRPKRDIAGTNGHRLLDESGRPQVLTFDSEDETPRGLTVWERDPQLELQLLVDFFQLDHRYRRGEFARHLRPAAAAFGLNSHMGLLNAARADWEELDSDEYNVHGDDATLLKVVQWLKRPAILRAVRAHSDPWGSNFKKVQDARALEEACGGQPWAWRRQGNRLVPALGETGKLDFAILRTLWQNAVLPDCPNLFLHSGCNILSPGKSRHVPYNHPGYGYWQGAEALLFYANGLALIGRAKTFYDFPTDFAEQLGKGKNFGQAWAHYFEVESGASDVGQVGGGIGRKRSYFWGVLGDATLTLVSGAGGA